MFQRNISFFEDGGGISCDLEFHLKEEFSVFEN